MLSVLQLISKNRVVLFLILLCIASRLPQLLGNNLIVDGDEAVYGLMVKHFLDGKDIPYYFYGQQYNFIGLELPITATFYLLFGMNDIALKLSMFLLWIIAIVFHYKAFKLVAKDDKYAIVASIILILSPSWALWSLKARGGYPTSFLLSSVVLYLLVNMEVKKSVFFWAIIGIMLGIIAETQLLWLFGLLPFLVYAAFKDGKFVNSLASIPTFAFCLIGFHSLKQGLNVTWSPQVFSFEYVSENLGRLYEMVHTHFTGSFVTAEYRSTTWATRTFAHIGTVLVILTTIWGILQFAFKKKNTTLLLCSISSIFIIVYMVFVHGSAPRYMLPLSGFFFMAFATGSHLIPRKVWYTSVTILITVGAFSILSFKDFKINGELPTSEKEELLQTIDYLKQNDVKYIFSPAPLLRWQIIFYTEEEIIGRSGDLNDRYLPHVAQCNQHLEELGGKQVAFVQYYGFFSEEDQKMGARFGERYGVILNPSKEFLSNHHFKFPEE